VLTKGDGTREEVDLTHEGRRVEHSDKPTMPEPVAVCGKERPLVLGAEVDASEGELAPPGSSPLDDALAVLAAGLEVDQDGASENTSVDESSVRDAQIAHDASDVDALARDDGDDGDEDGLAGALVVS
jgi:hypothetical protein